MAWQRDDGARWSRAANGQEWTFAKYVDEIMALIITIETDDIVQEELIRELQGAWHTLQRVYPLLLITYDEDTRQVTYDPTNEQGIQDTFRVVEDSLHHNEGRESVFDKTPTSDLPSLTYFTGSSQLVFRCTHWRNDLIGMMMLMNRYLQILVDPERERRCVSDDVEIIAERLNLCWYDSLGFSDKEEDSKPEHNAYLAQMLDETVRHLPSVGLAYRDAADDQSIVPRHYHVVLDKSSSAAVHTAARAANASVTAVVHAAMAKATYAVCNPTQAQFGLMCVVPRDLRRFSPWPQSSDEYAASAAMSASLHSLPRGASALSVQELAKLFVGIYRDFDAQTFFTSYGEQMKLLRDTCVAPHPEEWPLESAPCLSSVGKVGSWIQLQYGRADTVESRQKHTDKNEYGKTENENGEQRDAKDEDENKRQEAGGQRVAGIKVLDATLCVAPREREVVLHVFSWADRLSLVYSWNDGYYTGEDVRLFRGETLKALEEFTGDRLVEVHDLSLSMNMSHRTEM